MTDHGRKEPLLPEANAPAAAEASSPPPAQTSETAGYNGSVVRQLAGEAAGVGVWERDMATNRVSICPLCARILELPADHLTLSEQEWRALIPDADVPRNEEAIRQAAQTNQRFTAEYPFTLPSGRHIWVMVRGAVYKDAEGNPTRIVGVLMDITDRKETEQSLRASEERFRLLAEVSPDGILVLVEKKFVYANRSIIAMLGAKDASAVLGHSPRDFIPPSAWDLMQKRISAVLTGNELNAPHTWPVRRLDGRVVYLQGISGKASWNGQPAVQVLVRDMTDVIAYEEKLRVMNERLKLAVEGTGEGVWDWDILEDSYTISDNLCRILGYTPSQCKTPRKQVNFGSKVHPDDQTRRDAALQAAMDGRTPVYECEYRVRCMDKRWKWVLSRGVVVSRDKNGRALAMTGIVTDVTARKQSEETVWRHANLDALTGLPNRRHFLSEAESELRKSGRTGNKAALLFIDLDGFKQINDIYGHEAGDQLLIEATNRIRRCARVTDLLGRLGGDEFTVLLRDLHEPHHVEFVCHSILECLAKPFSIGSEIAHFSASIGVAVYPSDASNMDDLLRKADQAMYNAKATGKNQFNYFTQEMDDRAHARLRVSTELRRAISEQQLALEFHPVMDLLDGGLISVEALLRWRHPKLGEVAPSVFIPIAEEAGLMSEIGNWVFHEAARCVKRWSETSGKMMRVAINKSPSQFSRRNLEHDWLQYLHELRVPASSIVVEITEGMLLDASPQVSDKLLEYRDAGIQVAIDDFGTGYSSMAYLQKFDIDYLKIDQSFVRDVPEHKGNCTIVETMIVMAHKLGLKVIAEGIENRLQHDFLRQAGCDYGQGFFYSPVLPAERIEAMLGEQMH